MIITDIEYYVPRTNARTLQVIYSELRCTISTNFQRVDGKAE